MNSLFICKHDTASTLYQHFYLFHTNIEAENVFAELLKLLNHFEDCPLINKWKSFIHSSSSDYFMVHIL